MIPLNPCPVDIEVSDPGDFLRGDYWDAPPVMPTQVQFGAGSTTQTLNLTVPDDRRHLYLDGVTVTVLPSADYLLKFFGEDHDTSAVVYVNERRHRSAIGAQLREGRHKRRRR